MDAVQDTEPIKETFDAGSATPHIEARTERFARFRAFSHVFAISQFYDTAAWGSKGRLRPTVVHR
jgi:hypothetical protein